MAMHDILCYERIYLKIGKVYKEPFLKIPRKLQVVSEKDDKAAVDLEATISIRVRHT